MTRYIVNYVREEEPVASSVIEGVETPLQAELAFIDSPEQYIPQFEPSDTIDVIHVAEIWEDDAE